jgi:hypothetical protein
MNETFTDIHKPIFDTLIKINTQINPPPPPTALTPHQSTPTYTNTV